MTKKENLPETGEQLVEPVEQATSESSIQVARMADNSFFIQILPFIFTCCI